MFLLTFVEVVGNLGCVNKTLSLCFRDENFWHLLYLHKFKIGTFTTESWAEKFRARRRWSIKYEIIIIIIILYNYYFL